MSWQKLGIGSFVLWLAGTVLGAPPVTVIQDTLYKADSTEFEGILMINWRSFEASDTSSIPTNSITAQVVAGELFVKLVPTTTAPTAAYYSVRYVSDGAVQSTEFWSVPPSATPLRVRDVTVAWPPASTATVGQAATIPIEDVIGLTDALNLRPTKGGTYLASRAAVIGATGELEAASGGLTDCVRVDGTSGACGSAQPTFVDADVPSGVLDGVNTSFTLTSGPGPAASLLLFRNGILQQQGADYTLIGNAITMLAGAVPQSGDLLLAFYRTN